MSYGYLVTNGLQWSKSAGKLLSLLSLPGIRLEVKKPRSSTETVHRGKDQKKRDQAMVVAGIPVDARERGKIKENKRKNTLTSLKKAKWKNSHLSR